MRVTVHGTDLPGRTFCSPAGEPYDNVHVALQVRKVPDGLTRGDADLAQWVTDVAVSVDSDGSLDFRGPAVHGKRGDRFLYLTWGNVVGDGFEMFRRAKLMLNRIDPHMVQSAIDVGLAVRVQLRDEHGGPRCARVDPPAVVWSVD